MAFRVFTRLMAAATLFLILAGALVTSTGSGLSVPDWPTSYGYNMFTFPLHLMVGGIMFEHGHRLVASTVGFFTIVLAAWIWWRDDRRWLRWFGLAALALVIVQGVLGGLTVLFLLPDAISIGHAGLAQIFFCMMVAIAVFSSKGWLAPRAPVDDPKLRRLAAWTVGAVYLQILLGATMRHTGAGLAIPDFPLAFGGLLPPEWNARIAIHFAHRAGALVVVLLILRLVTYIRARHAGDRWLTRPAGTLGLLAIAQVTLGAYVVWTARDIYINSAHVMVGALVLAVSLILALRAHRVKFRSGAPGEAARGRTAVAA
ncbi:MAG TPA: COX15/CtaA family protein [Vicinamibacterales bacterium]|nr:COX15/CtaA family protein [Vicinamibacterales bacterium]